MNTSSVPTLVHAEADAPARHEWRHAKLPCTSKRYTGVLSPGLTPLVIVAASPWVVRTQSAEVAWPIGETA